MRKFFTFFLALVASTGQIFASDTQVNGIWYNFNNNAMTASVTYRGSSATQYSDEYSGIVVIPSSVTYNDITYNVTSIGSDAFSMCTSLTSITIPNSITSIGDFAFDYCSGLTSLIIPNSVVSIGTGAFWYCYGIANVYIPNSVTDIGLHAFHGCEALTYIKNFATTPQTVSDNIFDGVDQSKCTLDVPKESVNLYKEADVWKEFNVVSIVNGTCGTNLTWSLNFVDSTLTISGIGTMTSWGSTTDIPWYTYRPYIKSILLSNGITSIGENAFYYCSKLTDVEIPNSVMSIERGAFSSCYSLKNIIIPQGVSSIESFTFEDCGLTSVTIPNSVTSIKRGAFSGCDCLSSIEIPSSVTKIEERAFEYCYDLVSFINHAITPQKINSSSYTYVFEGVNVSSCTLYVPAASVDLYKATNVWKDFGYIIPISDTPTAIETPSNNIQKQTTKLLKDGQILIIRGDKTYTVTGQQIK